jgi:uncharacterized protein (DUF1330 family)
MAAYILAIIDEHDPVAFEAYREQALPVIAAYGGRSLLQGTRHERLEGDWAPKRVVVVEFPTMEQARAFHASEAYQGPKAVRHGAARTDMLLFEGRIEP